MMTPGEKVTDFAAGAAVASPWWLPALHDFSQVAGLLLPIAGVIWFAVQIGVKLHTTYWKKK
jgi:hypothetical protein